MNKYSITFYDGNGFMDSINCSTLKEVRKEVKALKEEGYMIDTIRNNIKGIYFDL